MVNVLPQARQVTDSSYQVLGCGDQAKVVDRRCCLAMVNVLLQARQVTDSSYQVLGWGDQARVEKNDLKDRII